MPKIHKRVGRLNNKNMRKLKNALIITCVIVLQGFYSCTDSTLHDLESKKAADLKTSGKNSGASLLSNECEILGPTSAVPSSACSYTYTDTYAPIQYVTWSVTAGNISVSSGQGTATAVFSFASNFAGGTIKASGMAGGLVCEEELVIAPFNLSIAITSITPHPGHIYPSLYEYTATYVAGATYYWYVDGNLQGTSNTNVFTTRIPCGITKTVYCTISTSTVCGSATSNSISEEGECY